ncbi:MAG: ATP-binding protein [Actinomycetota bacterium]|nr:ATP-binding protein [Actinomycetota bacterium]
MEEFTINIPREAGFSTVAGLVVGGIAARHDVTIDVLDDFQLALDSLLERGEDEAGQVSLIVQVEDHSIQVSVGPVGDTTVAELEQDVAEELGLRRLLEATVDDVSLTERDGQAWVELRKGYALAGTDG